MFYNEGAVPEETVTYLSDESRMAGGFVDAWLKREDWALGEWVGDFTGLSLPPLPPEEPYIWILEGLGTGAARAEREGKLADRLARVLESAPDREEPDENRTQALYNVLVLCSEVRRHEILGGPLKEVLDRELLPEIPLGYNLRFALRQALMMNPPGRDLEPLWVAMAKGETHPFLPSDRYDAFNGVLLLPPDANGEFAVASMSAVLKALAEALEKDEEREQERQDRFAAMLDQVTECWQLERHLAPFWRDSFFNHWLVWAKVRLVERILLEKTAVEEIQLILGDIERERRMRDSIPRRMLGEFFNTATVFVQRSRNAKDSLAEALSRLRAAWHREARVPVGTAALGFGI